VGGSARGDSFVPSAGGGAAWHLVTLAAAVILVALGIPSYLLLFVLLPIALCAGVSLAWAMVLFASAPRLRSVPWLWLTEPLALALTFGGLTYLLYSSTWYALFFPLAALLVIESLVLWLMTRRLATAVQVLFVVGAAVVAPVLVATRTSPALAVALDDSSVSHLRILLWLGADPNMRAGQNESMLNLAVHDPPHPYEPEIVTMLVDAGADPDAARGQWEDPFVAKLIRQHRIDLLRLIAAKGATLRVGDDGGATALSWAAFENDFETMAFLLARGASLAHLDERGQRPLFHATTPAMADYLLKAGARVDSRNRWMRTVLFSSATESPEMTAFYLDRGVPIDAQDSDGNTAIAFAIAEARRLDRCQDERRVGAIKVLLERNADLRLRNAKGLTARDVAVATGCAGLVALVDQYLHRPASKDL
jgi:ankyrin repeat protein